MALTNMKTTDNLVGITKQMTRSTYLVLKPRKANHVHMYSNVPTVMKITRWTPTNVCFGSISLTTNGTTIKLSRSMKTEPNQFA